MNKELNKKYVKSMDLWASNYVDENISLSNTNDIHASQMERNNTRIKLNQETLKIALDDYNQWRKKNNMKPVKDFKYIKA